MSFLYYRGTYVWINYKQGHKRHAKPLGLHVQRRSKKSGKWVFPAEALRIQKRIDGELVAGRFGLPKVQSEIVIRDATGLLLASKEGVISAGTRRQYEEVTAVLEDEFGEKAYVSDLTEEGIAAWRAKMLKSKLSQNTVAKKLRHASAILEFCRRKGLVVSNPVLPYKLSPEQKEPRAYTQKDLKAFFSEAERSDPDLGQQCMFLLLTGVRAEESCILRWDDLDFDAGVIRFTNRKGRRDEVFPIDSALLELLQNVRREDPFVFRYRNRFALYHAFSNVRSRAEIVGDIHTFKKTYANSLYDSGADLLTVSDLAHHTSIAVTQRAYLKRRQMDRKRQALEESRAPFRELIPKRLRLVKKKGT